MENIDLSNSELTESETKKLKKLLREYEDIFSTDDFDIGYTDVIRHEIDVGDSKPVKQRAYRIPKAQEAVVKEHIEQMLENGIIRPSISAWASPIVLVKKKGGNYRVCVDFRQVNVRTLNPPATPLPRVDEILDHLSKAKYFTSLDLASGYHQVAMEPGSIDKTAFSTKFGLFEYTRLPFGLTSAGATFTRLMEYAMSGLQWDGVLLYLDDILIHSQSFEEHLQKLSLVFQRLRGLNLKLRGKKCFFARHAVNYLGFIVTKDGLIPDPGKVNAVQSFPTPKSEANIRSFIGLSQYYRRFIEKFSVIAAPLTNLLKKGVKFEWTDGC
ncbi:MAG: hypothetical protein GY696_30465, partial [Gammaproteobacteria bacterium]|nr:hypothetical protein [Gammaproteobacteria bacterium]